MTGIKRFLSHINIPKLKDEAKLWEEYLSEKDLCDFLNSMQNNKSPAKDVLTK